MRLLAQELPSWTRGRFALMGAALLLGFVALLAVTVGTSDNTREEFLWPTLVVFPTVFIPVAALSVSQPRHSRFLHGVFTAPTTASAFFWAKYASALALGLAYLVAFVPPVVLYALHGVTDAQLPAYLWAGAGMVLHAVTLGTFLGVLFTARGSLATFATAVAAMVGTVVAMVFAPEVELLPAAARRALHASGGVLVQDALWIGGRRSVAAPEAALGYWVLTIGLLLLAWWIFVRHQSPEGWETSLRRSWPLLVVGCLVLGTPVAVAGTGYEVSRDHGGYSFDSGGGLMVRILPRGAPTPATFPLWYESDAITAGRPNEVDLLVFFYPYDGVGAHLRDVTVLLQGAGIDARPRSFHIRDVGVLPTADPKGTDPSTRWPYVRLATTLIPDDPKTLRENYHFLHVEGAFVGEDGNGHEGATTAFIVSDLPHAQAQMSLASAPAALACAGGFFVRRWRLR